MAERKSQRLRPGATDEEDALLDHDGEEDGWGTVGAVALDVHGVSLQQPPPVA